MSLERDSFFTRPGEVSSEFVREPDEQGNYLYTSSYSSVMRKGTDGVVWKETKRSERDHTGMEKRGRLREKDKQAHGIIEQRSNESAVWERREQITGLKSDQVEDFETQFQVGGTEEKKQIESGQ